MDKGNVKIRSKDGTNVTITNVFFVLEFVEYWTINKKKDISLISLMEFAPLVIKIRR